MKIMQNYKKIETKYVNVNMYSNFLDVCSRR